MTLQNRECYRDRAQTERVCAATATSIAAEIHLELARLYEKLAELNEPEKSKLTIVGDRLRA